MAHRHSRYRMTGLSTTWCYGVHTPVFYVSVLGMIIHWYMGDQEGGSRCHVVECTSSWHAHALAPWLPAISSVHSVSTSLHVDSDAEHLYYTPLW